MSTTTTKFGLIKPELTDAADITAMNENWDKIDSKFDDLDTTLETFESDFGALKIIVNLDAIGLVQGQETITSIAASLPVNSMLVMTVTSTHNTSEYPYQTGTLIATKTISTRVTFEYIDNNGVHYSGTVRGSGSSIEWLGWVNNPTPAEIGAAPAYSYSTTDLTAGSSSLTTGKLYFVYE